MRVKQLFHQDDADWTCRRHGHDGREARASERSGVLGACEACAQRLPRVARPSLLFGGIKYRREPHNKNSELKTHITALWGDAGECGEFVWGRFQKYTWGAP